MKLDPRNIRGYENLREILGDDLGNALYSCVDEYIKIENNEKLDLAIQQFIGFTSAIRCNNIINLVEAMGLEKSEWLSIRESDKHLFRSSDLEEIDEYFNIKIV